MDMQIKYALECPEFDRIYFTGRFNENTTPEVINTVEQAKLYDTVQEANDVRELPPLRDYRIREIILTRKAGQIVG